MKTIKVTTRELRKNLARYLKTKVIILNRDIPIAKLTPIKLKKI